MTKDSRFLVSCCHLGMFVQAMVINLTPLLFIPLREQFGLTFEQIGRLVLLNFLTQMVVDLVCTALADRVPTKPLVVAANFLAALGLVVFATAPFVLDSPYAGLVLGTLIFSTGCGLLEVLLSPIINAVPSERKSGAMALLHAFYPIGKVAVIIVTGLALWLAGVASWPAVVLIWALVPLLNTLGFALVRIPPLAPEQGGTGLLTMLRTPTLWLLLAAMALAGASEVTVAQWASAYIETGLGFSKVIADLVGFGLFGVGMVIGRLWFARHGEHEHLDATMRLGAAASAACAVAMATLPLPWLALIMAGASGFFVSMLWPGALSLAAARYPLAGASLFALLAAAGDGGGALMPWGVGVIADAVAHLPGIALGDLTPEQIGLRAALLVSAICPAALLPVLAALRRQAR